MFKKPLMQQPQIGVPDDTKEALKKFFVNFRLVIVVIATHDKKPLRIPFLLHLSTVT
jgi:hypothetical protein